MKTLKKFLSEHKALVLHGVEDHKDPYIKPKPTVEYAGYFKAQGGKQWKEPHHVFRVEHGPHGTMHIHHADFEKARLDATIYAHGGEDTPYPKHAYR